MTDTRPAYLVLNRWGEQFAEYHRFLDRDSCRLACVTTADGADVLERERVHDLAVVPDLDFDTVVPVARRMAQRAGGFAGVVGISEYDLVTAARLRAHFGTPGYDLELVDRFKDKIAMKSAVASAGLRVPRFLVLTAKTTTREVVATVGLPVIVKPRNGAASEGVELVTDAGRLLDLFGGIDLPAHECEEYVDGEILHVDGIRRASAFHFVSVSAYVHTCLDFAAGTPLGSVLLDDSARRERIVAFAAACLDALGLADGPFHLELIETPAGELVFLEVGLRPGGGEITYVHDDLFGVDLVGEAVRATLGLPPLRSPAAVAPPFGAGWVLIPEPRPHPSEVVARTSLFGVVPEIYREILPDVGTVFDGGGGYTHIGGRFHLRGRDERALRRAVADIFRRYELVSRPADRQVALR